MGEIVDTHEGIIVVNDEQKTSLVVDVQSPRVLSTGDSASGRPVPSTLRSETEAGLTIEKESVSFKPSGTSKNRRATTH